MERKTNIVAEEGKQDILILREFEIPVDLLFTAYADASIIEQWMGTEVLKLESRKHGSYEFETKNPEGIVVFKAGGVIHEFSPNRKIARTFEMENASLGIQLEVLSFEALTAETSKLTIHVIYESVT